MADSAEILRLMRHAADLLAEQDPVVVDAFKERARHHRDDFHQNQVPFNAALSDMVAYAAASSLAQNVLRMVATFMTETGEQ